MRRKRRKVEGNPDESIEELAREIVFDEGLSYNLVSSMLKEEVPAAKRTDRANCLAVSD